MIIGDFTFFNCFPKRFINAELINLLLTLLFTMILSKYPNAFNFSLTV